MICVTDTPNKTKQAESEEIVADVEAYLKAGGKVYHAAAGESAHKWNFKIFICHGCGGSQDKMPGLSVCRSCYNKRQNRYDQARRLRRSGDV